MGHPVHGVVGLDLGGGELGHVGHLVHLLGEGLLREQHFGLLIGLGRVALLQELETRCVSCLGLSADDREADDREDRDKADSPLGFASSVWGPASLPSVPPSVPASLGTAMLLAVIRCVTVTTKVAGLTLAWNSTCISLACCLLDMVAVVAVARGCIRLVLVGNDSERVPGSTLLVVGGARGP